MFGGDLSKHAIMSQKLPPLKVRKLRLCNFPKHCAKIDHFNDERKFCTFSSQSRMPFLLKKVKFLKVVCYMRVLTTYRWIINDMQMCMTQSHRWKKRVHSSISWASHFRENRAYSLILWYHLRTLLKVTSAAVFNHLYCSRWRKILVHENWNWEKLPNSHITTRS